MVVKSVGMVSLSVGGYFCLVNLVGRRNRRVLLSCQSGR